MSKHTFANYEDGYQELLDTMVIKTSWVPIFKNVAKKIEANKERYEAVSDMAGGSIPWQFIGVIHNLECSLNFNEHLHNGDPLSRKTRRVPKGRPLTKGPWTWEESAVDALRMKGYHRIKDWSMARVCYELEKYNGFGYRQFRINSPYLWSGTNHYSVGKYVSDGKFSRTAVSKQTGALPLYKELRNITTSVDVNDIVKHSQKLRVVQNIINFFKVAVTSIGGLFGLDFFTDSINVIGEAKKVVDHEPTIFVVAGIVGLVYVLAEYIKHRSIKDVKEGRYVPSGLDKPDV